MSSLSSPRDLAALPSGTRVFIDANIFIYHFTHTPLTAACTAFLQTTSRARRSEQLHSTSVRLCWLTAESFYSLQPRLAQGGAR